MSTTFCWVQDKLKVVLRCSSSIQLDLILQSYWRIIFLFPLHHQLTLWDPLPFSKLIHFLPGNLHKIKSLISFFFWLREINPGKKIREFNWDSNPRLSECYSQTLLPKLLQFSLVVTYTRIGHWSYFPSLLCKLPIFWNVQSYLTSLKLNL